MPSVLYSTTCYHKNDHYRLSICTDDGNNMNEPIDSFEFTSTDIPIENLTHSLTRLNFDLLNEKKTTSIPQTITLSHLLNVQQSETISNKKRRNFNNSNEIINTNDITPSIADQSQQTSHTTLNTNTSQVDTLSTRRQFDFKRFFSTQSYTDSEANSTFKKLIKISYVDVSKAVRWNIKRLEFEVETEDIANELYANLNLCLSTLKQRPHHLLAFVNPLCGKGQARFVYEKKVLPIFKEANINVDTIYTERANHAQEYVVNEELNDYDGLICVGGDGMFAELCHGLLLRTSVEAQLNIDDPQVNIIRPDIRIGIIPAGSTDAVVFGTTGLNDPVTSALQIIAGESLSIDITTVHNENGFVRFMATMLAYGFFGDIIHQSDKWRCLGPLRYDLAGFCQFVRNRSYHSELTITLSPHDPSHTCHSHLVTPINNVNGEIPSDSQQLLNNINRIPLENSQINKPLQIIQQIVIPALEFCSRNCETCALEENLDPTKIHLPLQIKREGRYSTVNCLNMPCRCAKSKFGMSPFVHLGDGTFDLILVKRSWRTGFLRFLWQVANDSRSIEDLPNVERYRVSEVRIRPMHTDRKRLGNWSCDGELILGNEIQVRIHRQALNLFASGIQLDKVNEYKPTKTNQTNKCCSCFQNGEREAQEAN